MRTIAAGILLVLAGGGLAGCAGHGGPAVRVDPDEHATSVRPAHHAPTTKENRRLARVASTRAVASVPLPVHTRRHAGKPRGWPDDGISLGPSDDRLTRTRWWSTSQDKAAVAAFLTAHTPAGMRHPRGEDVINDGSSDGVAYTEYDPLRAAHPAAYTGPDLVVQFATIGERTVLRADTFLAARHAVSPRHRIHGRVVAIRIDRVGPTRGRSFRNHRLPPVRLTAPRDEPAIHRLVRAFDRLEGSITANWVASCPFMGSPPREVKVSFRTVTGGVVVADLQPDCWGQVHETVDGVPLAVTLDPGGWAALVDRVAGAAG